MPEIKTVEIPHATYKQVGLIKYLMELKQGIVLEPNHSYKQFKTNYKGYPEVKTLDIEQASRLIEHLQALPNVNTAKEKTEETCPVNLAQPEPIVEVEGDDILWE